jgi:hypothetical protein
MRLLTLCSDADLYSLLCFRIERFDYDRFNGVRIAVQFSKASATTQVEVVE